MSKSRIKKIEKKTHFWFFLEIPVCLKSEQHTTMFMYCVSSKTLNHRCDCCMRGGCTVCEHSVTRRLTHTEELILSSTSHLYSHYMYTYQNVQWLVQVMPFALGIYLIIITYWSRWTAFYALGPIKGNFPCVRCWKVKIGTASWCDVLLGLVCVCVCVCYLLFALYFLTTPILTT